MDFDKRNATPAEVIAHSKFYLTYNRPVTYRHFTKEILMPHAKHGVAHRMHSRSTLRVIDDVPHVMYNGELTPVTASIITINGSDTLYDLRIDNEYLPPLHKF